MDDNMKSMKRTLALLLSVLMLASAAACGKEGGETVDSTEAPAMEETLPQEEAEESAEEPEEEKPADETVPAPDTAEAETEITLPSSEELLETPDSVITGYSDDKDTEEELAAEEAAKQEATEQAKAEEEAKQEEEAEPEEPSRIYNYLNGKTTTVEERDRRPVAIMINNIKKSLPQHGICEGDIYYECAAEGGITRIMMLVADYENLPTVGSIRSSRDYFVDFLHNHDAIYVHAGGSGQAYDKILTRGINNLDGVNMYLPTTFWRDQWRRENMGYEHSMMTNGPEIVNGIEFKDYRTALDENQVPLFNFYDENTDNKLVGSPAPHIRMQSTSIQTVDFVYNEETGEYLRYQYNGMPHVDGTTGEQLSVKNVLILFTDISLIPGDEAGRLAVGTVGSGQGYYITNGKRKVVNWSREGKTSTMHIEYRNGDELILNSGKTFICVVDNSVAKKIDFEYEW